MLPAVCLGTGLSGLRKDATSRASKAPVVSARNECAAFVWFRAANHGATRESRAATASTPSSARGIGRQESAVRIGRHGAAGASRKGGAGPGGAGGGRPGAGQRGPNGAPPRAGSL